jgi:hypothetical protein
MSRSHLRLVRGNQGCLGAFFASMRGEAAASVAFEGIFGAFAEEYRVLEDGCGHLLPVFRVVRGFEVFSGRHGNTTLGTSVV